MRSSEILHGINLVAISTYNLCFCDSSSALIEARRAIRTHLQALRPSISDQLYIVLFDALDNAYQERLSKIKEFE